jgi:hypothetical protein
MIFQACNENGIPTWQLVIHPDATRRKTVTRRTHPVKVGSIRAVQVGRGKRAIAYIKILSCEWHVDWETHRRYTPEEYQIEARKEGFHTYDGLLDWFDDHEKSILDTYRIEFELYETVWSDINETK